MSPSSSSSGDSDAPFKKENGGSQELIEKAIHGEYGTDKQHEIHRGSDCIVLTTLIVSLFSQGIPQLGILPLPFPNLVHV